jgi:hypothetical protein
MNEEGKRRNRKKVLRLIRGRKERRGGKNQPTVNIRSEPRSI